MIELITGNNGRDLEKALIHLHEAVVFNLDESMMIGSDLRLSLYMAYRFKKVLTAFIEANDQEFLDPETSQSFCIKCLSDKALRATQCQENP